MQSLDITTVVIPTLANRPAELDRAIASVTAQHGAPAIPVVVVNGQQSIPEYVRVLERRSDIRFARTPVASVSDARLLGLQYVDSPLFAFLDDDDELLPQATTVRNEALIDGSADVVATNGWRQYGTDRTRKFDYSRNTADPAKDLLEFNWMLSASASYSTARVPREMFENLGDLMEITRFALRISLALRVRRIDTPTFVVNEDAAQRASMSRRYTDAIPDVLQQMYAETKRPDLRRTLARLRGAALHFGSNAALEAGEIGNAWRLHLRSLTAPAGMRYLSYSRHLLAAALGFR